MESQIEKHKEIILEILKKHEVIEFKGDKSLLDLAALQIELEEKLKLKVDVLTFNSIHPLLKEQILAEQVEIL